MSDGEDRWVGPGHWEWVPNENPKRQRRPKRKPPVDGAEPTTQPAELSAPDTDQQEAPHSW
jgi:hypothetical protein